jgi:hypothetical protein
MLGYTQLVWPSTRGVGSSPQFTVNYEDNWYHVHEQTKERKKKGTYLRSRHAMNVQHLQTHALASRAVWVDMSLPDLVWWMAGCGLLLPSYSNLTHIGTRYWTHPFGGVDPPYFPVFQKGTNTMPLMQSSTDSIKGNQFAHAHASMLVIFQKS